MSPPGRPPIENKKDVKFSIRLDKEFNDRLELFSKQKKKSKAEIIRKALEQYLDNN